MHANEEGSILDDRQRRSPATQDDVLGTSEPVLSGRTRWITGPFVRLLATNMAFGFSISCFYLLPKYLTVAYGAAPGTVGAVMGIFGLTCVLVEQNVAVSLKLANRAYVLENGRITLSGTGEELLADDRVRQAYLGM